MFLPRTPLSTQPGTLGHSINDVTPSYLLNLQSSEHPQEEEALIFSPYLYRSKLRLEVK